MGDPDHLGRQSSLEDHLHVGVNGVGAQAPQERRQASGLGQQAGSEQGGLGELHAAVEDRERLQVHAHPQAPVALRQRSQVRHDQVRLHPPFQQGLEQCQETLVGAAEVLGERVHEDHAHGPCAAS